MTKEGPFNSLENAIRAAESDDGRPRKTGKGKKGESEKGSTPKKSPSTSKARAPISSAQKTGQSYGEKKAAQRAAANANKGVEVEKGTLMGDSLMQGVAEALIGAISPVEGSSGSETPTPGVTPEAISENTETQAKHPVSAIKAASKPAAHKSAPGPISSRDIIGETETAILGSESSIFEHTAAIPTEITIDQNESIGEEDEEREGVEEGSDADTSIGDNAAENLVKVESETSAGETENQDKGISDSKEEPPVALITPQENANQKVKENVLTKAEIVGKKITQEHVIDALNDIKYTEETREEKVQRARQLRADINTGVQSGKHPLNNEEKEYWLNELNELMNEVLDKYDASGALTEPNETVPASTPVLTEAEILLAEEKEAKSIEEKKAIERMKIFERPMPKNTEQAVTRIEDMMEDVGFRQYLEISDRQYDTAFEAAFENGNSKIIKEQYQYYLVARTAHRDLKEVFKNEVAQDFGKDIQISESNLKEVDRYTSRLVFENPEKICEIAAQSYEYFQAPKEIERAEQGLKEELTRFNATDLQGLKVALDDKNRVTRGHIDLADQIEKDLKDKKLMWHSRGKKVAQMYAAGFLTEDEKGFRFWNSADKLKRAAENIRIMHQMEANKVSEGLRNINVQEAYELHYKRQYKMLRKNLLVDLEPSESVRTAIAEEIKKQVTQTAEDEESNLDILMSKQRVLDVVEKRNQTSRETAEALRPSTWAPILSENGSDFTYMTEDERAELQQELDKAFHKVLAKEIAKVIDKDEIRDKGYATFEKQLFTAIKNPDLRGPKYGSATGPEAKNLILKILTEKREALKQKAKETHNSDTRIFLINTLIGKIKASPNA